MNKLRQLPGAALIVVFVAIAAAACGGGGGQSEAPFALTVGSMSPTAIQLSWRAPHHYGAQLYRIYRNGLYLAETFVPSYNDTGLAPNTRYCYEVTVTASYDRGRRSTSECDWTYAWIVSTSPADARIYDIAYGKYPNYPQFAALTTYSSYFRMIYGPTANWGTSIVLFPVFWSGGLHQGTTVSASWQAVGDDLVIASSGVLAGLSADITIHLYPPANDVFSATVSVATAGTVVLDNRPGEAFKPVMLSSMNIGPNYWDSQYGYVGATQYAFPASGWITNPPATGTQFGLKGGTSSSLWQPNKPSVEIALDRSMGITGWVTPSTNFNDDNIGFWAATDVVLPSWHYTITAKR